MDPSPETTRAQDAPTIVAAIGGTFAVLGLVFLAIGIARRVEPAVPPPEVLVPGALAAEASRVDAGPDAARPRGASAPVVRVPYPLDDVPRRGELAVDGCPEVPLVEHVGAPIPWRPVFRVNPVFVPSVRALEAVILETSREIYGRDPVVLLSASGYRCTSVRGRPERISEHALGNAIDVRGIELDDETTIDVRDHWHTAPGADPIHARFWRVLTARVIERGLFRGVIGPPDPDHMDHLHFDQGPSSFVAVSLD